MSEEGKQIRVKLEPIGMGLFAHNLTCWICNKDSAVYSASPEWIFKPCWDCQKKFKGQWTKPKNPLARKIRKCFLYVYHIITLTKQSHED